MKLQLELTATAGREQRAFLRRHVVAAHGLLRSPLRELSLVLVGDAAMSRLHDRFMQQPIPTDVLSFPLDFDERGRVSAGEVVLCVGEARRQARRRKTPLSHELLLYAIHGLLHLSGFDDRTEIEYRKMHRMEDRLLIQLGVGAVFAPTTGPAPAGGGAHS